VSDRLVRRAPMPVLVIRPDDSMVTPGERPPRIARIIVPLDGSTRAERALPLAGELARQLQLPLTLVRVVTPPDTAEGPIVDAADAVAEVRRDLERAASRPALRGTATATDVLVGEAARCLLELAGPSDVLVLTSHGCGGIPRWLLGSVAEQVVRLAAAPVLVVPDAHRPKAEPDADVSEGL
jgi:nucleotide-binding universal stress UspA family protein